MSEKQGKLSALETSIRAAQAGPAVVSGELARLEREARNRMANVRAVLTGHPVEARDLLFKILAGPLLLTPLVTPEGQRFRIEGEVPPAALLSGMPNYASFGGGF